MLTWNMLLRTSSILFSRLSWPAICGAIEWNLWHRRPWSHRIWIHPWRFRAPEVSLHCLLVAPKTWKHRSSEREFLSYPLRWSWVRSRLTIGSLEAWTQCLFGIPNRTRSTAAGTYGRTTCTGFSKDLGGASICSTWNYATQKNRACSLSIANFLKLCHANSVSCMESLWLKTAESCCYRHAGFLHLLQRNFWCHLHHGGPVSLHHL